MSDGRLGVGDVGAILRVALFLAGSRFLSAKCVGHHIMETSVSVVS